MPDLNSQTKISDLRAETAIVAQTLNARDVNINAPAPPRKVRQSPRKLPPLTGIFVGRKCTLNAIASHFSKPRGAGVVAEWVIHGHGGIGKTTTATKYAWEHLEAYPGGLFLIDCSADDFSDAIADLYNAIFDVEQSDRENTIVAARRVTSYFNSCTERFLLILDNVKDVAHWKQLLRSEYLPAGLCDRLITTVDPDIPIASLCPLERLSTAEGILLLAHYRNNILSVRDRQAAEAIVDWFGGVPFSLSSLGIYMSRNPKLSWQDYAASLNQKGLIAVRQTEHFAGVLPDGYDRRFDEVLDNLLNSLDQNERRTLEYSVLLFPGEVLEYAVLIILSYDATMVLEPSPGYDNAARYVIQKLENEGLFLPRGEGGGRAFTIHDILRHKLNENISKKKSYKQQLLSNIYKAITESYISVQKIIICDGYLIAYPPVALFFHCRMTILEALEKHKFIPNAAYVNNYWINVADRFQVAKRFATEVNGTVDMSFQDNAPTEFRGFPAVVIDRCELDKVIELANKHGGLVQSNFEQASNRHVCRVIFPIVL
jgi:hypothetical protein